jgi:hypothetical protein
MARRTFDVVDIIEILVHWHAGWNNTETAASLDVDRKTVRWPRLHCGQSSSAVSRMASRKAASASAYR